MNLANIASLILLIITLKDKKKLLDFLVITGLIIIILNSLGLMKLINYSWIPFLIIALINTGLIKINYK